MLKRQYRFKQQFFEIDGNYNVPAHVICAGNYDLKTYCCKNCGEIYVIDYENPVRQNISASELVKNQMCESCGSNLEKNLVKYPENIFFKGSIHFNDKKIDHLHFEETYLKSAYTV